MEISDILNRRALKNTVAIWLESDVILKKKDRGCGGFRGDIKL